MNNNKIAIIGVGYVGLPLLEAFNSNCENDVIGFDISEKRIFDVKQEKIQQGKQLHLTSNIKEIAFANTYIVTVPTPIDDMNKPDLTCLSKACEMIGTIIKKNDIIVFESTVYPTMTEDFCIPIIENKANLCGGKDFFFGYSPERINIGDSEHTLRNTIKIVSGCDEQTTIKIADIYKSIQGLKVEKVASIKVAEAAKLMENTQRDILIAFANEYSTFCEQIGINIDDVISAASTKWNFSQVYPGLVGGHCIGVDPYYLLKKAKDLGITLPLVSQARKTNENKVAYVACKLIDKIRSLRTTDKNDKILILGFSYKKNSADIRNTKIANLVYKLEKYGYQVQVFDPLIDRKKAERQYKIQIVTKEEIIRTKYLIILEAVHHDVFHNFLIDNGIYNEHIKIEQLL